MTTSSPATNEAVASTNSSDVRSTNPATSSAGPVEATTSVDKVTSVATLLADTEAATTLDTASGGLDTVTSLELNTNPAPSSSSATVATAGAETATAGAESEPETTAQSLLVSESPAPAPAPSSSSASAKHSNASSKSAVKGDLSKSQTDIDLNHRALLNSDLLLISDPISDDISDTEVTKSVLSTDEIFTTQQNYSQSSIIVFLGENQTETISEINTSETMPLDGVNEFEELEAKSGKGEEAHELAESRSLKMEEVPDCVLQPPPTPTHPHPPCSASVITHNIAPSAYSVLFFGSLEYIMCKL